MATTSSTTPSSPSARPHIPLKSPSTSHLPKISLSPNYFDEMSTIPDPRSRRVSDAHDADSSADGSSPTQHPDLNDEVATLSTKLINAINHQTALDDSLSAARQELETANGRIRDLEAQNTSQRQSMQATITSETALRIETEKEKKKIEQELENLTTALFEEANRMVIGAKEEAQQQQDAIQRKNDQLKAQLEDSEALLKSQQEQLTELKRVLETMAERDDQTNVTTPSSPGITKFESNDDGLGFQDSAATSPIYENMAPAPPTSLQHLIQPVLRHDLGAYNDFIALARHSHQRAGSRISSGSMGGLTALTLGLGGSTSSNSNGLPLSAPQSPNTVSGSSTASTPNLPPPPSLKETKFYKRALVEDIEPTLRLDNAPGLSWLARRSVLTAVTDGNLVVEPVATTNAAKAQLNACALCGEARKEAPFLRYHRFRTSEADSAQRYPLCSYCVARVRSTCGFLGFLRMIKDGHWRADDDDHEKTAWEESVRLREQMFWARIGGGVVPTSQIDGTGSEAFRSPRTSHERHTSERSPTTHLKPDAAIAAQAAATTTTTTAATTTTPEVPPRTPPEQTARVAQLARGFDALSGSAAN